MCTLNTGLRKQKIISRWKRESPSFTLKLNPLYPIKLCAKFGWNLPSGSGEEVKCVKR